MPISKIPSMEPRRPVPQASGYPRKFSKFLSFSKYRSDEIVRPYFIVALDGTGDFDNIQTAIDALPTNGGGILIKPGTYTITSSLLVKANNVSIQGSGPSSKIVTSGNIVAFTYGVAGASPIEVSDVEVSDLWFYGSGSGNNANWGIFFRRAIKCKLTNCLISNFGREAIMDSYESSVNNFISYNNISDNFDSGILISNAKKSIYTNNIIISNSDNGIEFSIFLNTSDNNTITNNYIANNGNWGIYIVSGCNSNVIINNTIINNTNGPISDGGGNTQIGHNITS